MAEITKEYLQKKLKEAENARDQALADANAWQGAVLQLHRLLEYAGKDEIKNVPKPK